MKRTFSFQLLIVLFASVTLFACSKSNPAPDNGTAGATATFDGTLYKNVSPPPALKKEVTKGTFYAKFI